MLKNILVVELIMVIQVSFMSSVNRLFDLHHSKNSGHLTFRVCQLVDSFRVMSKANKNTPVIYDTYEYIKHVKYVKHLKQTQHNERPLICLTPCRSGYKIMFFFFLFFWFSKQINFNTFLKPKTWSGPQSVCKGKLVNIDRNINCHVIWLYMIVVLLLNPTWSKKTVVSVVQ